MVKSISENTEWIEKKIVDSLLEGESTPIEHGVAVGFNIGEDLLLNLTPFIERGKRYSVMKIGDTILIRPDLSNDVYNYREPKRCIE